MIRNFGNGAHSRVAVRVLSTAVQVANSRIFEIRNTGNNLIVMKSLILRAMQVAAGTAQENSLDVYKLTGFTAVDTTNTVTPTPNLMKTNSLFTSGAAVRALNPNANGMTGGTLTKAASPIASMPYNVATAINITTIREHEVFPDLSGGGEPLILQKDEGILVESRVLNVTSFGVAWFIDALWQEAVA